MKRAFALVFVLSLMMTSITLAKEPAVEGDVLSVTTYVNSSTLGETASIRLQADALVAEADTESLLADAVTGIVDYSVPISVRESVIASAEFIPVIGVAEDEIEFEVSSTVQKMGELTRDNGETANLYVAVAVAANVKEDEKYKTQYGIMAWACVYWIDISGTENELHAAAGQWEIENVVVTNRQLRYGTTDIFWALWTDGPTVKYPTSNWAYYEDSSTYTGFVLRCETRIDVVNLGTVICNVGSRITT
jgi:hypothetical protein